MKESDEKSDVPNGDPKPNIKAFINQFNNKPMKFPKPSPASTKPSPPVKPAQHHHPAVNGLKPVIAKPTDIKKVTLKRVEVKPRDPSGQANPLKPLKTAVVPPVSKKPVVDKTNKENKPPPPIAAKRPQPPSLTTPAAEANGVNLDEIKNRLKKTGNSNASILRKKEKAAEPEYDGEKVYTSADGIQYRALKMPSNPGTPPTKPSLPPHPDLYDFQVEDAVDDDLYEDYSDVVVPSSGNTQVRPVSLIPEFSEADELREFPQEEYTDTEVPANQRPMSMQDEEYYEALDS